jgi:hypothetical protein
VRAGHERTSPPSFDNRLAIKTIDGAGLDAAGDIHSDHEEDMWLSQAFTVQGNPPDQRGGTAFGGHWIEFAFDQAYSIDEMLIWNYAENSSSLNPDGSRRTYFWSAQGLRQVVIQATTVSDPSGLWGSENVNDWQLVFAGDLDAYHPGQFNVANNTIPFGGSSAQYVVITTSTNPLNLNWVAEKVPTHFPNLDGGLSEVRFSVIPPSVVPARIDQAVYYPIESSLQHMYQLFGRDTSSSVTWYAIGDPIVGTGGTVYGFERSPTPSFLPSRAWSDSLEGSDGYSLGFDGVDDFAFRSHEPLLNVAGAMTVEAWVKPSAVGNAGTIAAKAASPAVVCYRIGVDSSDHVLFQLYDDAAAQITQLISVGTVELDTWTHVAATYDQVTAKLYLNGVEDASDPASGVVRTSTLAPFLIGSIVGTDPYGGLIDEVRLWGYARSAADVLNTHTTKLSGTENLLTGYWELQEPGSQMAADSTANELDLTLGVNYTPDALDPEWIEESYLGADLFTELFEFGADWYLVSWDSLFGSTYTVEATSNLCHDTWISVEEGIPGTGQEMNYLEIPPTDPLDIAPLRHFRILRSP